MIDVVSFIKHISSTGDALLAKSDIDSDGRKPTQVSVFNNYFETNSEKDVNNFLNDMYGISKED